MCGFEKPYLLMSLCWLGRGYLGGRGSCRHPLLSSKGLVYAHDVRVVQRAPRWHALVLPNPREADVGIRAHGATNTQTEPQRLSVTTHFDAMTARKRCRSMRAAVATSAMPRA